MTMIAALWIAAAPLPQVATEPPLFDAGGYRAARYRAPVSGPPKDVPRIDARAVARLVDRHAVLLIDVMPAEGGNRDPATGRWRLAVERRSIAGAHWFPEAGRAPLDPGIERWFRAGIRRLHRANPHKPIVLFCLADCWMSWNAAKRLRSWGYRNVHWFAEGADGWTDINRPLVVLQPYTPPKEH